MKKFLLDHTPLGVASVKEGVWCFVGLIVSIAYSLLFFVRLYSTANFLEEVMRSGMAEDIIGPHYTAHFPEEILGFALSGFFVVFICMVGMILYHYSYHWYGSKSIYLMRRLPDQMELHRRCLTLPVLTMVLSVVLAFVLYCVYYRIYRVVIPPEFTEDFRFPFFWVRFWVGDIFGYVK